MKKEDCKLIIQLVNEKLKRHFSKHQKYHQPTIQKHLAERQQIAKGFKD